MINTQENAENKRENNLHLVYKKVGETPLGAMERYRQENPDLVGVSMTYAGRLDPMAEGLLLVLTGDGVLEKQKYLGLDKTYVFKVLWGFETDSLDILGVLGEKVYKNEDVPTQKMVANCLESLIGTFEQKYPVYSSKTVGGVPLFKLAREGKIADIKIPTHEVFVSSACFVSREIFPSEKILSDILSKIDLVSGDFRQIEIKQKWQEVLGSEKSKLVVDTIEMKVGSGFYVRQFVADLAKSFQTKALTFHILRTRVGVFHI